MEKNRPVGRGVRLELAPAGTRPRLLLLGLHDLSDPRRSAGRKIRRQMGFRPWDLVHVSVQPRQSSSRSFQSRIIYRRARSHRTGRGLSLYLLSCDDSLRNEHAMQSCP